MSHKPEVLATELGYPKNASRIMATLLGTAVWTSSLPSNSIGNEAAAVHLAREDLIATQAAAGGDSPLITPIQFFNQQSVFVKKFHQLSILIPNLPFPVIFAETVEAVPFFPSI